MQLEPVKSDAITHLGYDAKLGRAGVRMRSGHTYYYEDIRPEEFQALRSASSIGAHFAAHWRSKTHSAVFKPQPLVKAARKSRWAAASVLGACVATRAQSPYVTLIGQLQASNGVPAANLTLNFTPTQQFTIAGTTTVVATTTQCATSSDGTVVGIANPTQPPQITTSTAGTLPAGTYYVEYAYTSGTGTTLVSPEAVVQLGQPGAISVSGGSYTGGIAAYVGVSSGLESLAGSGVGSVLIRSSPPPSASVVATTPGNNTTRCLMAANDAGVPTGTGYRVSLTDSSGNALPGYPQVWQLNGAGTTINLSAGLPYYSGAVFYPSPIVAVPTNHNVQSISGPLSLGAYKLSSGFVDAIGGYAISGAAPNGHLLVGNGSHYVDSATIPGSALAALNLPYQAVQASGQAVTSRGALDFLSPFTVVDDAANARTLVGLGNTGVAAGTYSNPTITVGADGRVVAANSGGASGTATSTSGTDEWFSVPLCTPPSNEQCGQTVTLPNAMVDANYFIEATLDANGCAGNGRTCSAYFSTDQRTSTTFQLVVNAGQPGTLSPPNMNAMLHIHHN